jgi:hypothetical protein
MRRTGERAGSAQSDDVAGVVEVLRRTAGRPRMATEWLLKFASKPQPSGGHAAYQAALAGVSRTERLEFTTFCAGGLVVQPEQPPGSPRMQVVLASAESVLAARRAVCALLEALARGEVPAGHRGAPRTLRPGPGGRLVLVEGHSFEEAAVDRALLLLRGLPPPRRCEATLRGVTCGAWFIPTRANRKWCSEDCATRERRRRYRVKQQSPRPGPDR